MAYLFQDFPHTKYHSLAGSLDNIDHANLKKSIFTTIQKILLTNLSPHAILYHKTSHFYICKYVTAHFPISQTFSLPFWQLHENSYVCLLWKINVALWALRNNCIINLNPFVAVLDMLPFAMLSPPTFLNRIQWSLTFLDLEMLLEFYKIAHTQFL